MRQLVVCLGTALASLAGNLSAQVTFADWKETTFDPVDWTNEDISGALADPDGDGQKNLQEFVFVGDPLVSDGALITPMPDMVAGSFTLSYRERHDLEGVDITLQGSNTLFDWVTFNSVTEADRATANGYDEVTLVDPATPIGGRRFLRMGLHMSSPGTLRAPVKGSFEVQSPNQWRVRWTDTNTIETGHAIERLRGLYTWERIGTLGADESNWLHTEADHQASFTYRVVAQGAGTAEVASAPFSLADSDGDLIPDVFELGSSYAGLAGTYASSPTDFSTNGSGVADGWLAANGHDPAAPPAWDTNTEEAPPVINYVALRLAPGHEYEGDLTALKVTESGKVLLSFPEYGVLSEDDILGYRWSEGQMQELRRPSQQEDPYPDFPGYSRLQDMNSAGEVVGYFTRQDTSFGVTHSYPWATSDSGFFQTAAHWPAEQPDASPLSPPNNPSPLIGGYQATHITDSGNIYGRVVMLAREPLYAYVPFSIDDGLHWTSSTATATRLGTEWSGDVETPRIARIPYRYSDNGLHDIVRAEHGFFTASTYPEGGQAPAWPDPANDYDRYEIDGSLIASDALPVAINNSGRWITHLAVPTETGTQNLLHYSEDLESLTPVVFGTPVAINNHHDILGSTSAGRSLWKWLPDTEGSGFKYIQHSVNITTPEGWSTYGSLARGFTSAGLFAGHIRQTHDDQGNLIPYNQQTVAPALFFPVELNSRDRLVKGSITIPEGWTNVSLRLRNLDTEQDLGVFAQLEPGVEDGSTYIYDDPEDMFSEAELDEAEAGTIDPRALNQAVTFYRDAEDPRRLHFTTAFDDLGKIELELSFGSGATPAVAKLKHTLTADADMAALIDTVDQRIETIETPGVVDFDLDTDGDGIPDGGSNDLIIASQPGTAGSPGSFVGESAEDDPLNLIMLANTDDDDADGIADWMFGPLSPEDDDLSTIILKRPAGLTGNTGTFTVTLTGGASIRLRTASGQTVTGGTTVNLASPSGPLAGLAAGPVTLYLDGVAPTTASVTLTYDDPATSTIIADSVHLTVLDPAQFAAHRARHYLRPAAGDLHGVTLRTYVANGRYTEHRQQLSPIGENPPLQNRGLVAKTLHRVFGGHAVVLAHFRGMATGFAMGIKDDGEFIGGVIAYVGIEENKIDRAKAMFDPFVEMYEVFKDKSASEITSIILAMPQTLWSDFYEEAEAELGWEPLFEGIDPQVVAYMNGIAIGYLIEQVAVGSIPVGGTAVRITKTLPTIVREMAEALINSARYVSGVITAKIKAVLRQLPGLSRLVRTEEEARAALHALQKARRIELLGGLTVPEILDGFRRLRPQLYDEVFEIWADTLHTLPQISAQRLTHQMNDLASVLNRFGDAAVDFPDDAVKGFAHLQGRLFKTGDDTISRWPDVEKLFGGLDNTAKKDALKESLIAYKIAVDADPEAKFLIKNITAIQPQAYRYDSFTPQGGWANFSGSIPDRPAGWWCSFDFYDNKYIATDRLLLPLETSAPLYRFEFATTEIVDKARVGRGLNDEALFFEPLTRDIPDSFVGAGTSIQGLGSQFIADGVATLQRVVDMNTGQQVWPIQ